MPYGSFPSSPAALLGAALFHHPPRREGASDRAVSHRAPSGRGRRGSWGRGAFIATALAALAGAAFAVVSRPAPSDPASPLAVPEAVLGSERHGSIDRMAAEMDTLIDRLDALSRGEALAPMQEDRP